MLKVEIDRSIGPPGKLRAIAPPRHDLEGALTEFFNPHDWFGERFSICWLPAELGLVQFGFTQKNLGRWHRRFWANRNDSGLSLKRQLGLSRD